MKKITTLLFTLLIGIGVFSASAQASQCKGLPKSTCSNNLDCSWTKSYERADGKKVKGYCRAKSGKAAKKKLNAKKKKATAKANKKKSDAKKKAVEKKN